MNAQKMTQKSLEALQSWLLYTSECLAQKYRKINGVWEDHLHMVKLNEAMHRQPG